MTHPARLYDSPYDSPVTRLHDPWGASWGEKGYIRIERFGGKATEKCLTDKTPGDGTACKGDPATMEVCGLCGILSDSSYPVGGSLV